MSKEIPWTKPIIETFLEESGINYRIKVGDEKAKILAGIIITRFAGWTISKQAHKYNISVDTVNKYIREIKDLYDQTQMLCSDLPLRKKTKKELDEQDTK